MREVSGYLQSKAPAAPLHEGVRGQGWGALVHDCGPVGEPMLHIISAMRAVLPPGAPNNNTAWVVEYH